MSQEVIVCAENAPGLQSAYGLGKNICIEYKTEMDNGVISIAVTGTKQDISVGLTKNNHTYNY
jgi:hypothetical protein